MSSRILAFVRGNAIGLFALFVAVSGTAYAAASLPSNSVGTKQLKKNAVTGQKLAAGAVTASKVKHGSLTGNEINASTLGLVPNASHAASAASATTAINAGHAVTADHLAGKTPADFVPAGRVLSSGWKTLTACGNACATNVTLLDNGTFDVRAGCQGNGSGPGAFSFVATEGSGTTASYFEAFSGSSRAAQTEDQFYVEPSGATTVQIHAVNFDLVSSAGSGLAGTVTVISNTPSSGHCAYEATAISG
jgi:hypothetical protein